MKIAIVDDLLEDRTLIYEYIQYYCKCKKIDVKVDAFENGNMFFKHYSKGKYEIIFLDIYMTGMTGMDVAKKLRSQNEDSHLIFVTTSSEHAIGSYEVRATHYLLKPVHPESLEKVMDICCEKLKNDRYIEILSNRILTKVPLKTILFAETYQNAITLHTTAGCIKTYITFQKFQEMLDRDSRFLYCYKGCVVNMDHIVGTSEDCFLMYNHESVPIRKREKNAIKSMYTNYLLNECTLEDQE